jgi:hypothetical protein
MGATSKSSPRRNSGKTNNRIHYKELILSHIYVKAIPVTSHGGPYSCEMSRIPHVIDSWQ